MHGDDGSSTASTTSAGGRWLIVTSTSLASSTQIVTVPLDRYTPGDAKRTPSTGRTVSTATLTVSYGVGCTLPAASTARTSNTYGPSARFAVRAASAALVSHGPPLTRTVALAVLMSSRATVTRSNDELATVMTSDPPTATLLAFVNDDVGG